MTHPRPYTVAHVTHEAVEKVGGIGTVLEGMMSSPVYQKAVGRSILVGPMGGHHFESPLRRFGEHGTVFYSTPDGIDTKGLARIFHPIERAYGVGISFGSRVFVDEGTGRSGEAEVLLFDVSNPARGPLNDFKSRLWTSFGIDAARFEHDWGFEEYCRIAEPAFYGLSAIIDEDELPCIVISHEFMGMCTALKTVLDGGPYFRTVFYAHECATARKIVEEHPGHDCAFYNILRRESKRGLFVEDVFGDQSGNMRHELISRAHHLDAIAAVGDPTSHEMQFLNSETKNGNVQIVYNGIPEIPTTPESKKQSREMLASWAQAVVGSRPDYLVTHVARPVISKGLWRDLKVAGAMEPMLAERNRTAVLMILTCGAPPRSREQVDQMSKTYGWPRVHRAGYPDLVGPETGIFSMIEPFNRTFKHVQCVLVNQFGWSRDLIGSSVPEGMTFTDLRRATDVEFGQSVYEPFGIAQFEPLGAGAICVPSSVCGCVASWRHVLGRMGANERDCPCVLVADYTDLNGHETSEAKSDILKMTREERNEVEERVAHRMADRLFRSLPQTDDDRNQLIEAGHRCAQLMSWDSVIEQELLPLFAQIVNRDEK